MASVWDKIDPGLSLIYSNYLSVREHGHKAVLALPEVADGGRLLVQLRYAGDLAPVKAAGFQVVVDDGHGRATGGLRLEDLEAIAARDEVLGIRYGSEPQLMDKSIPQIRANQLWTLGAGPNFVFSGDTGAGALVGVIDSGADINHPFLWLQSKPVKKTRIRRIWDLGLDAIVGESAPPVALLEGGAGGTYGVEYKDTDIDKVLQGLPGIPIRSRDCAGHGTHVASTAAGDGRFKFKFVGVAPRAELIIVKFLHLEKEPKVGPNTVGPDQKFKDAVTYIRKVADSLGKPVVINFSAGSDLGAHDGLDERDDWLSNEFKDAGSAGKVFVTSAGNSAGDQQHALIEFTGAGSVELPFELTDGRAGPLKESPSCISKDNTMSPFIDFYYPNGGATITGAFKPTGVAAFKAGPALGAVAVPGVFGGHSFSLQHAVDEDAQIAGPNVKRNRFRVIVNAVPSTLHLPGTYTIKITASAAVKVHVWCFQNRRQDFKVKVPPPPPTATVTVTVADDNLVGSPGCAKNVITVAAYDAEVPTLDVTKYSSRGPVPRHGVGGPAPAKPDIGAPGGVKSTALGIARGVDAAKSADTMPMLVVGPTISMQGTSMASPHVAGAVALLLAKKPGLKPSEVLGLLQTNALKAPPATPNELGAGRLDVKKAFDNIPP